MYYSRNREEWLEKLTEPGVRQRASLLYQPLDTWRGLRREAKKAMLKESGRHPAYPILRQIPVLGPIRIAQILAKVASPYRFRTKRQFWAYGGLAVVTRSSADYHLVEGRAEKRQRAPMTRGLNPNFNHRLKYVFKSAALDGTPRAPFEGYYARLIAKGIRPELARLTLARKIAAVTLTLWKRGEGFDELKVSEPAA